MIADFILLKILIQIDWWIELIEIIIFSLFQFQVLIIWANEHIYFTVYFVYQCWLLLEVNWR